MALGPPPCLTMWRKPRVLGFTGASRAATPEPEGRALIALVLSSLLCVSSCSRSCCRNSRTCSTRRSAPSACRTRCTSARLRARLLASTSAQAPNLLRFLPLETPQFEERELLLPPVPH